MNTKELFELAVLDAYGCLDEDLRPAFEEAFRAAPPAIRRQLRAEQSRLVRDPWLLADATPSPELREGVLAEVGAENIRDRVLERVRGEMGLARTVRTPDEPADDEAELDLGLEPIAFVPSRHVARSWRLFGLTAAAAAVVLAVTAVYLRDKIGTIEAQMAERPVMSELLRYGPVSDLLFDESTRRVTFAPAAPDFNGRASAFVTGEAPAFAQVFWSNLPTTPGKVYRVVAVNRDESERELHRVTTASGLQSARVEFDPRTIDHLAIYEVAANEPSSRGRLVLESGRILG